MGLFPDNYGLFGNDFHHSLTCCEATSYSHADIAAVRFVKPVSHFKLVLPFKFKFHNVRGCL